MIKARLIKLEKTLSPKSDGYKLCYRFLDGTIEYEGQKFADEQDFKLKVNPGNLIVYLNSYKSI